LKCGMNYSYGIRTVMLKTNMQMTVMQILSHMLMQIEFAYRTSLLVGF